MFNSSRTLRLGLRLVRGFPDVYELKRAEGCVASGFFGAMIRQFIVEPFANLGINCTASEFEQGGSFNEETGKYDGAIGALVNDELDVYLFPRKFPLKIDAQLGQTPIIKDDAIVVISLYNMTESTEVEIIDLFSQIDIIYYIALFLIFILLLLFWKFMQSNLCQANKDFKRKIKSTRKSPTWIMLCALLDEDQFPHISNLSMSTIAIITSMSFWLIIDQWILGIVGTDLVVFKQPPVITTYAEFLARDKIKLLLLYGVEEVDMFTKADNESPEYKMTKNLQLIHIELDSYNSFMQPLIEQRAGGWGRKYYLTAIWFIIASKNKDIRALMVPDEKGKHVNNVFYYRANADDDMTRFLLHRCSIILEFGILDHIFDDMLPEYTQNPDIQTMVRLSSKIQYDEMPEPFVAIFHIKKLFIMLGILLAVCLAVLITEICIGHIRRKTKTVKKNKRVKSY